MVFLKSERKRIVNLESCIEQKCSKDGGMVKVFLHEGKVIVIRVTLTDDMHSLSKKDMGRNLDSK